MTPAPAVFDRSRSTTTVAITNACPGDFPAMSPVFQPSRGPWHGRCLLITRVGGQTPVLEGPRVITTRLTFSVERVDSRVSHPAQAAALAMVVDRTRDRAGAVRWTHASLIASQRHCSPDSRAAAPFKRLPEAAWGLRSAGLRPTRRRPKNITSPGVANDAKSAAERRNAVGSNWRAEHSRR